MLVKVKVNQSCYRPEQAQRLERGIALSFCDLGTRRMCVVSITPKPLYLREKTVTNCIGGWVGHRASLDVCKKSCPKLLALFERKSSRSKTYFTQNTLTESTKQ
jgi:hypothetical protein